MGMKNCSAYGLELDKVPEELLSRFNKVLSQIDKNFRIEKNLWDKLKKHYDLQYKKTGIEPDSDSSDTSAEIVKETPRANKKPESEVKDGHRSQESNPEKGERKIEQKERKENEKKHKKQME